MTSRSIDGIMHAPWCHLIKPPEEPEPDGGEPECNCNPCTTCDGHGQYGDENGETMACLACNDQEELTHRRARS